MKTILFLSLLACAPAWAQLPWVQTVVFFPGTVTNEFGGIDQILATNTMTIPAGQAAKVVTVKPVDNFAGDLAILTVTKLGASWRFYLGDTVQGPAEFTIISLPKGMMYGGPTLVTLERWRVPKVIPAR